MHTLVTPDTDFSNISWNWICYQRAFSAIYQKYFWKVTIYWCHFITDVIVYTYAEFGRNCWKNKLNITHCSECCVVYLVKPVLKVTCQSTVNQIPLILDQGSCGLIKSAMTHEKNLTLYETNTYAVKPLKTSNYSYTKEPIHTR